MEENKINKEADLISRCLIQDLRQIIEQIGI